MLRDAPFQSGLRAMRNSNRDMANAMGRTWCLVRMAYSCADMPVAIFAYVIVELICKEVVLFSVDRKFFLLHLRGIPSIFAYSRELNTHLQKRGVDVVS
jgi:hypothetical protein